jgi:hypothetical protein
VSRPSVREALIALEVEGWVEVRTGSGVYVQDRRRSATRRARGRQAGRMGPARVIRARRVVEGESAALAAVHASKPQIATRWRSALAQMRERPRRRGAARGDRAFHLAIVQACGNGVLTETVQSFWDSRQGPLFTRLGDYFENRRVLARHRRTRGHPGRHPRPRPRGGPRRHAAAHGQIHQRFSVSWKRPPTTPMIDEDPHDSLHPTPSERRRADRALPAGRRQPVEGVAVRGLIPPGHKIAVRAIAGRRAGAPLQPDHRLRQQADRRRRTRAHAQPRTWARTRADFARDYAFGADVKPARRRREATFMGIKRADGRVATRNYIGVLSSVNCSATAARAIADHFSRRPIRRRWRTTPTSTAWSRSPTAPAAAWTPKAWACRSWSARWPATPPMPTSRR